MPNKFSALSPEGEIFPKRHLACFGEISEPELSALAVTLKETLLRIYVGLGHPDVNYIIRSVSPHDGPVKYFRRPRGERAVPEGSETGVPGRRNQRRKDA